MKKYYFKELRQKAIATFLQTCTYILEIQYGIDDKVKVFDAIGTDFNHGDYVLFGRPSTCKVRYTLKGRAYIIHNGRRLHLDNTYRLQAE